jgi:hypothetical protein
MKKIIILFSGAILFSAYSCHKKAMVKKESASAPQSNSSGQVDEIRKATVDAAADMGTTGSPYKVDSLSITGDVLSVFVNYSGGCKEHSFKLLSNGMYAKSMPPQLSLCLQHSGNDDQCRKLVMQELKFDVSDLRYKSGNTVILKIGDKKVNYTVNP